MKKFYKPGIKGYGDYQKEKIRNSIWLIFKALSDGQWHRNMELREKTKLSPRILDKYLTQMVKLKIIEKQTDFESGKYPYPVLYKVRPELTTDIKRTIAREEFANQMESMLNETKDPLILLDSIHAISRDCFVDLLKQIQQNKNITDEEINFFSEGFLWANYKQFTFKLIEASRKIINDLNLRQCAINQCERQIEINTELLKRYKETEKSNIAVPSKNAH